MRLRGTVVATARRASAVGLVWSEREQRRPPLETGCTVFAYERTVTPATAPWPQQVQDSDDADPAHAFLRNGSRRPSRPGRRLPRRSDTPRRPERPQATP